MPKNPAGNVEQTQLIEMLSHLSWSTDRLKEEQNLALRDLIAHAKRHAPFYANRLSHIDTETFTAEDLTTIEPLTKTELMDHWDQVVTVPDITLEKCEAHLMNISKDNLLLEGYRVVATGGTTGHRAIVLYSPAEFNAHFGGAVLMRWYVYWAITTGNRELLGQKNGMIAEIFSSSPAHASGGAAASDQIKVFSVTMPLPAIVSGLNEVKPLVLMSYPSMLRLLAEETLQGRLKASPSIVYSFAEPLPPDTLNIIKQAWDAVVFNVYGASEAGYIAMSSGQSKGMYLNEDLTMIELVDSHGNHVKPGESSTKIFVTPLFRRSLPLLRYELSDEAALLEEPTHNGLPFRQIDHILGRVDDIFYYETLPIHPNLFRSVIVKYKAITSYQIKQTRAGADVHFTAKGPIDGDALKKEFLVELSKAGLNAPQITVSPVETIPRSGNAQKIRRFVPLP